MLEGYRFLFPFEYVSAHSKIVIYGASEVGVEYLYQIRMTNYCDIVAILDRNYKEFDALSCTVLPPEGIKDLVYDYVVVAMRTGRNIDEVVRFLRKNGVSDEQIVIAPQRDGIEIYENEKNEEGYAFEKCSLSIMINYSGGIGDSIARIPFIKAIIKEAPECMIDLFAVKHADFVKYLLKDTKNINLVSSRTGEKGKYTVAFDGLPRTIKVSWLKEKRMQELNPAFYDKIKNMLVYNDIENFSWSLPYYVLWKRYLYESKDYYSSQDCHGILEIDCNVDIPLTDTGYQLYLKNELHDYICICTGNGTSSETSLITKAWPKDYFEQLIDIIKKEFSRLEVVQIDSAETGRLGNADKHLLGKPFEEISWVLKETRLLISIDGGMVHLASQLGTKCAALFGPTSINYWGYDKNINISSNACEPCFGMYGNSYRCAKGMDKPVCMYSMTPEYVFEKIRDYLSKDKKETGYEDSK